MATMNQLYPSRFLKAEDLDSEGISFSIHGLELEEVGSDQEDKPVLYFKEIDKGLILNKTNFKTIASIHGADSDDWVGKKVTLYPTEVEFSGKTTLGIRVRLVALKPAAKVIQRPPMHSVPEFGDDIPEEPTEEEDL